MPLVDSHCHLDRIDLSEVGGSLDEALKEAREKGVTGFLCVDIDLDNFQDVLTIAEKYPDVWCSAGVHPLAKIAADQLDSDELKRLALSSDKVIAVGECGLDYYYDADTADNQRQIFEKQLKVACEIGKPVIVHTREAREDTLALLRKYVPQGLTGVLHCFTESLEMAEAAVDLGFYISFSGIITFRNAEPLREVVRRVPMDKILVETDSPYLAPVPYRGKSNQPKWVVEVAQWVADLKGIGFEQLGQATTENFRSLFKLPE
ncbi:hydrolase TatD [Hahella sp. CCB-MM4]|uniref:TatD family hydrolase n=1 Tax=Hahella sp. (strain CCB-MM4) TaxID=1926491 RepID=UPI000B9BD215|nr:TatD family hydrolase [Hahella sp. CCB-MM4]OZG73672.1 hydrolase TatD [Hahella sp. CCB-MM4]